MIFNQTRRFSLGLIRSLLAILWFLGTAAAGEPPPDANRIPPVSLLRSITLGAWPGWTLDIMPDGSAAITYGDGPLGAFAPAGTFDFNKVYRSLAPIVGPAGNMQQFFTVGFHQRGVTMTYSQYTKADFVRNLFVTAKKKGTALIDPARLEDVWQRNPPKLSQ